MAQTNYGIALGKFDTNLVYTTIGQVTNIDPPEMMRDAIESTNHASGGERQFISGGLSEVGQFKATINYVKANIAALYTDLKAGTVGRYQVMFDSTGPNAQQFGALVTAIKPLGADAKSPDVLRAEITFRPTDSTSISS